jgi:hypothetical protein
MFGASLYAVDSSALKGYLDSLNRRFTDASFSFDSGFELKGYDIKLFGIKKIYSLNLIGTGFVIVVSTNETGVDFIQNFVQDAFKAADQHKRSFAGIWVFPVVASDVFADDVKVSIQKFPQTRMSQQSGKWMPLHPVLAELRTKQIYHNTKRPLIDLFGVRSALNFAEKYLLF